MSRESESTNTALDGVFKLDSNSIPSSVGLIANTNTGATLDASTQTARLTGVVGSSAVALDIAMHDQSGNAYGASNPLFVGQGTSLTVTANQGGNWFVGQSGPFNVGQTGNWFVGQSGPFNVGQTGLWFMGQSGPFIVGQTGNWFVGQSGPFTVGQTGYWSVGQTNLWFMGQSGPYIVGQTGYWSVGQTNNWFVGQSGPFNVGQTGNWFVGQSGPFNVGQTGNWFVGQSGPFNVRVFDESGATFSSANPLEVQISDGATFITSTQLPGSLVTKTAIDVKNTLVSKGYYCAVFVFQQTAATPATTTVFSMRNAAASTKTVYIERIWLMIDFDTGNPITRTPLAYELRRFTTATPTGGTVVTAGQFDSTDPATQVTDIRFLNTGLTVTGVVFDAGNIGLIAGPSTSGASISSTKDDGPSIKLAPGEGLAIRLNQVAIVGQELGGEIIWSER